MTYLGGGTPSPVGWAPGQVISTAVSGAQTGHWTVETTKPGGMAAGVHVAGLPSHVSVIV